VVRKLIAAAGIAGGASAAGFAGWPIVLVLVTLPLTALAMFIWVLRRQDLTDRAVKLIKAGRGKGR
jgi:hypothetical protein